MPSRRPRETSGAGEFVSTALFVTFTPSFFHDLDAQLPVRRRDGVPSRTDFLSYELANIREWFSTRFDELAPVVPGRDDYRQLVIGGRVVRAVGVVGQLTPHGTVEILELVIDIASADGDPDERDA
jgi:hypothetical protein